MSSIRQFFAARGSSLVRTTCFSLLRAGGFVSRARSAHTLRRVVARDTRTTHGRRRLDAEASADGEPRREGRLKVRAGAHHPERTAPARDRAARPSPRPTPPADRPSSPVPRPHPPQITRRLIAKLDGEEPASPPRPRARPDQHQRADRPRRPPGGVPHPGARLSSHAATRDAAAVADYRPMFPGLDDALARSLRVGELLPEERTGGVGEGARVRQPSAEATTHAFRRGETPCGEEREACRKCYEENAADTLRCGAEVAAYDACARAASEAFVGKGFPAKAAADAEAAA